MPRSLIYHRRIIHIVVNKSKGLTNKLWEENDGKQTEGPVQPTCLQLAWVPTSTRSKLGSRESLIIFTPRNLWARPPRWLLGVRQCL